MASCYRFEDIEVDLRGFRLFKGGITLSVEPKALTLLIFLVENRGRLVRKRELMEAVWSDAFVTEQVLSRAVGQLRKVLDDSARQPRYIETVPTLGFRFIAEVESGPASPSDSVIGDSATASALQPAPTETLDSGGSRHAFLARGQRTPSVGVLPFANLSADPENEFFADGITQDVIAHLAKIKALKVISRSSVMTFKNSRCSLREIGERLGVGALVEGSVRHAGNRVRIVAQLVDTATDEHLWAETYDRDLTDIFSIQTDVALNIAEALRAELSRDERVRVARWPTDDLEAYDLYLRGRDWFYRFTQEGFLRSLIASNAAVVRDPGFALAWTSIAEAHAELCIEGLVPGAPDETIRMARAAASRALEIDEELAEAHSLSGLIRFVFDFDWPGAERDFIRAIELCPGSAEAHDYYGWLCASLERYDDALRQVRFAKELNPLIVKSDVASTLLRAGRNQEALEEAQRMLQSEPNPRCHSVLGWAQIFNGEPAAGIDSLVRATVLAPGATLFLSQLGEAFALTGNIARAQEILKGLRDRATREFVSPYHFAYIHAGLGEVDAAIDWLENAFERRSGGIYGIKGSYLFRNLHGHPRFESLLRKMNLA
jgi:TolB-like protein